MPTSPWAARRPGHAPPTSSWSVPGLGEQVAWGESNAIVFANSVLGARTNRYGDFFDICCAITGRAPAVACTPTRVGWRPSHLDLRVPDWLLDDELLYPVLGHVLGQVAGTEVAVITGLDQRADEDRLKALGAAAASSGAVAMFHVVGVTPEADRPSPRPPEGHAAVARSSSMLDRLRLPGQSLESGRGHLGAVSVGTPHISTARAEPP